MLWCGVEKRCEKFDPVPFVPFDVGNSNAAEEKIRISAKQSNAWYPA